MVPKEKIQIQPVEVFCLLGLEAKPPNILSHCSFPSCAHFTFPLLVPV